MHTHAASQEWNPKLYQQHASFVGQYGRDLLGLLPEPPARVLDLGCGDGTLTAELAARGYEVTGIDASESMVAATRARGLRAEQADGHALPFAASRFDLVFSNATLHWLRDPDRALASVARVLSPAGRFVAELGGAGNTARVLQALVSELEQRGIRGGAAMPWFFPSVGDYATRLERAGFRVDFVATFDRPTPLPGDVIAWLETFAQSFTNQLPQAERADFLAAVRTRLAPQLCDATGRWVLDYVRLRFGATKRG